MSIKTLLEASVRAAMSAAGIPAECQPAVARSNKPQFGDFQANGAMAAAKLMQTNPRQLGEKIMAHLDLTGVAEKTEIAGPGFINIFLSADFLAAQVDSQQLEQPTPQTIVVDLSSPNLAKEMHVGHLRSTIIGDAVARALEYLGHNVIRQNHMGDWGTQFGMLIAELEQHLGEGEQAEMALGDLEKFYQQAKKHFDDDPAFADKARANVVKLQSGDAQCRALWQQFIDISIAHSEEIYHKLDVKLTRADIKPESAYNDALPGIIKLLEEKGLAVDDQGAKVVFLQTLADKSGNPSPFIVQKSGGGFLYSTTDLATLDYRVNSLKADRLLYFIDARQSLHMKQVFATGQLAGLVDDSVSLEHHAFGTMMGKDGKPFKTRSGGTVKLADLLVEAEERAEKIILEKNPDLSEVERKQIAHTVGIGAVKYADLSKTRTNDYIFDWDAMLSFEGNTAPYLQYAYTRIRAIFRKADIELETFNSRVILAAEQERTLAKQLLQFNEVVEQVAADALPHQLCNYLYDLASQFMSFYEHCPILKEGIAPETRDSRLQLSKKSADTLKTGLDLLGIGVMEKM